MKLNKIYNGDCLEVMKTFPDNSIDTIITDPPYGLSFMGKKWDYDVPKVELWKEALRVLKPGGTALIFAGSRTQHRMACAVEDAGFILKDCIMWLYGVGFPKATDISKQLDKGHKRKVIGRNPNSRENCDKSNTLYESGTVGKTDEITEPATSEAKLWNGWKSHGLKPAYEPIIVAMKPNDGTYANNAIKHGVAGLNIDGGRIDTSDEDFKSIDRSGNARPDIRSGKYIGAEGYNGVQPIRPEGQGRFPANIILDEEAAKMLDEQSGESQSNKKDCVDEVDSNVSTFGSSSKRKVTRHSDKGGASRFFYCAKASKSERNAGCEEIDGNKHPTIKPLKLMEYLCTLTKTPTGGIVLDPFAGSGTTCMACKKTGRPFIGIEQDKEYCKIAEARIEATIVDNKLF